MRSKLQIENLFHLLLKDKVIRKDKAETFVTKNLNLVIIINFLTVSIVRVISRKAIVKMLSRQANTENSLYYKSRKVKIPLAFPFELKQILILDSNV